MTGVGPGRVGELRQLAGVLGREPLASHLEHVEAKTDPRA